MEMFNFAYGSNLSTLTAFIYYPARTNQDIKPFHWYRQHVFAGARKHSFPEKYIEQIAGIASIDDHNPRRTERERNIYLPDSSPYM